MALPLKAPPVSFFHVRRYSQPPKPSKIDLSLYQTHHNKSSVAFSSVFSAKSSDNGFNGSRKFPILLFDIMDTIVRDPFFDDVPAFFRMSFEELIESQHPTAWMEFEKGTIDEGELAKIFFKDGRPFDLEGLKDCLKKGYFYKEGVEELLQALKENNYEMHAFTNYPVWYKLIEEKLRISRYLEWTFCSCKSGKRKPDHDFFFEALEHLKIEPQNCVFIDDRLENVEAAIEVGIVGLNFKNADLLLHHLSQIGVHIPPPQPRHAKNFPTTTHNQITVLD